MNQSTNKLTASTLSALASSPDAANKGTQQYLTPYLYAEALMVPLTYIRPTITDLHCGNGDLASAAANDTTLHLLGHDIDPSARIIKHHNYPKIKRSTIHNDITQTFPLLYNTQTKFDLLTLNPPFSLRWSLEDLPMLRGKKEDRIKTKYIDSTHATIRMSNELLTPRGESLIICNTAAFHRLRDKFPNDFKHLWMAVTMPSFFPGVSKSLSVSALYFDRSRDNAGLPPKEKHITYTNPAELTEQLVKLRRKNRPARQGITDVMQRHHSTEKNFQAVKEEIARIKLKRKRKPNITIDPVSGFIQTHLTSFQNRDATISAEEARHIRRINNKHSYELVLEKGSRNILGKLINSNIWTICPQAKAAITKAIASYHNGRYTLTPLTPVQCLGWIDDKDDILCTKDFSFFKKGHRYNVESKTVHFLKTEMRPCIVNGKRTKEKVKVNGHDLQIAIKDDQSSCKVHFMHIPDRSSIKNCHDLNTLSEHFEIPTVPDVIDAHPELYQGNLKKLESMLRPQWGFKKFQAEDLARAGCTDGCIFGHVQGLGKSLAAFAYPMLKDARRTLIVAPAGLIKQFRETAAKFYGKPLPVLSSIDDLKKYKLHLPPKPNSPPQFFITNYEALTRNGADEWQPKLDKNNQPIMRDNEKKRIINYRTWATKQAFARLTGTKYDPTECFASIGKSHHGITCLWKPSMASMLAIYEGQGAGFDCISLDEATRLQAAKAHTACGIRKLNPAYRILLTGTPIKNKIDSVFFLLHYAAGGHEHPTAQFPFTADSESQERFASLHLEHDRYITREETKKAAALATGEKFNSKIVKRSARICNIHHLWKLIAPTIIRRRKDDCGEDIVEKTTRPILVKPGTAQLAVYGHHLKHRPIAPKGSPTKRLHGRAAIGCQLTILRQVALCPDDKELGKVINGNHKQLKTSWTLWTPKLSATLSLISKLLSEGEQVIIGSPFRPFNNNLHELLNEAKVPNLFLDGQTNAKKRGLLIKQFKNKMTPVLIAGVKAMGEGHSLECCSHLILPSYSWAYDENDQFIDRIWRLVSKKPVTVYPIVTEGTIDELMALNYADKKDSAQLALDGRILCEQVDDIDPEILLADAYDKYRSNPESTPEETLEDGWPALRKSLTIANRLYNEFHPPIIHGQVTEDDIINARNAINSENTPEENFNIQKARTKQKLLAQQKANQRKRRK